MYLSRTYVIQDRQAIPVGLVTFTLCSQIGSRASDVDVAGSRINNRTSLADVPLGSEWKNILFTAYFRPSPFRRPVYYNIYIDTRGRTGVKLILLKMDN